MDGIRFIPLTVEQQRRLDAKGNRVWTEQEVRIMKANLATHDYARTILNRRCGVKDCKFIIKSTRESLALPNHSDVCDICYYMWHALRNPALRDPEYFVKLHEQWKRDNEPPDWRKRDKLGL